jgi:hypothetical protein
MQKDKSIGNNFGRKKVAYEWSWKFPQAGQLK